LKHKNEVGKALGKVASGLFVVTVKHDKSEDAVLASWVNQCSFDPPGLTIVLSKVRPARLLLEASGQFVVNVLGEDSNDLMKHFFGAPKGSVFEGLKVGKGFHGIKILEDAIAYLECELTQMSDVGDHILYVGEVVGGNLLKGGEPHLHVRKNGFNY